MVLEPRSPSAYNAMLGRSSFSPATPPPRKPVVVPASHNHDSSGLFDTRATKRVKRDHDTSDNDLSDNGAVSRSHRRPGSVHSTPHKSRNKQSVPDSDADSGNEELRPVQEESRSTQTDLEQALPPIKTDKQAIAEYELFRAQETASTSGNATLDNYLSAPRDWVRGKSSIYVDAFFLALDTVLAEESHLFSPSEKRVFDEFKAMSYDAQYLYVRLFLRKTSAWFRIGKLGYYSDITDMDAATDELFSRRPLPDSGPQDNADQVTPGELAPPEGTELEGQGFTFADDSTEHITSLEEASSLLLLWLSISKC